MNARYFRTFLFSLVIGLLGVPPQTSFCMQPQGQLPANGQEDGLFQAFKRACYTTAKTKLLSLLAHSIPTLVNGLEMEELHADGILQTWQKMCESIYECTNTIMASNENSLSYFTNNHTEINDTAIASNRDILYCSINNEQIQLLFARITWFFTLCYGTSKLLDSLGYDIKLFLSNPSMDYLAQAYPEIAGGSAALLYRGMHTILTHDLGFGPVDIVAALLPTILGALATYDNRTCIKYMFAFLVAYFLTETLATSL